MHSDLFLVEERRRIPIQGEYDLVVCGAGPAGIAAAISAGRAGARVCLVEGQGCLGGVWTSGLLSYILDAREKPGLIREIRDRLRARRALALERDLYDAEEMKILLEEMCRESGVEVRLYSRLAAAQRHGSRIEHALFESKEGRFALGGKFFVDTTGDGDLGAYAQCGFDFGREEDGLTQPMTLMALVANIPDSIRTASYASQMSASCMSKREFFEKLVSAGASPTYTLPSIFPLPNDLCAIMVNHSYEKSALDSRDLTEATLETRREIHHLVDSMRQFSPEWSKVCLVATAAHIGVREGRRIHGLYTVTAEDVVSGRRHPDAIARVNFPIDIHSVKKSDGGGYGSGHLASQPYDIPLRALIARDVENLFMAGRCLSGDFHAHASYRVTGNAVATGEAAGRAAAYCRETGIVPHQIDPVDFFAWKPGELQITPPGDSITA